MGRGDHKHQGKTGEGSQQAAAGHRQQVRRRYLCCLFPRGTHDTSEFSIRQEIPAPLVECKVSLPDTQITSETNCVTDESLRWHGGGHEEVVSWQGGGFGRVMMAGGDEKAMDRHEWMVFGRWEVDKRTGK